MHRIESVSQAAEAPLWSSYLDQGMMSCWGPNPLQPTHEWSKYLGNQNRTILLLEIFQNGHYNPGDGASCGIQSVDVARRRPLLL